MRVILYYLLFNAPIFYGLQFTKGYDYWVLSGLAFCWLTHHAWHRKNVGGAVIFVLGSGLTFLNLLFSISLYTQGTGFNEPFFFHLRLSTLGVATGAFPWLFFGGILLWLLVACFPFLLDDRKTKSRSLVSVLLVAAILFNAPLLSFANFVINSKLFLLERPLPASGSKPAVITEPAPRKKSIVLIYAESLESTFANPEVFADDQTPVLSELSKEGFDFAQMHQVPGTGWTMAGLVASQCGLPMDYAFGANSLFAAVPVPLPGSVCMGDVLNGYGYNLSFLGGAPLYFAGKGRFLAAHGYQSVNGRDELRGELKRNARVSQWGIYDQDLFGLARAKLDRFAEQDEYFLLTLLSLDTHNPNGYPSPDCQIEPEKQFLSSVKCSDRRIAEFIEYVRNHHPDVLVVLFSDHLAMRNGASGVLDRHQSDRRLRFTLWSQGLAPGQSDERGTHFDVAPTILEAAGIPSYRTLENGASLFSRASPWFLNGEQTGEPGGRSRKLQLGEKATDGLRSAKLSGDIVFRRTWSGPIVAFDGVEFFATDEGEHLSGRIFAIEFDESRNVTRIIDNKDMQAFQDELSDRFVIGISMDDEFNRFYAREGEGRLLYFAGSLKKKIYRAESFFFSTRIKGEEIDSLYSRASGASPQG